MCGIAGAIGDLRGVDTAAMLRAIAHRGPDDEGEWHLDRGAAGALWFGHRRLSILDLSSAGHQPMHSHDRRLTIVFNGEIYNFKELRAELTLRGRTFLSGTDTEVILAAYEEHGLDALRSFKGMFAFALWDDRESTLVLARDRLGERPLYYAKLRDRFVFASEVRALLASGVVERELDPDGLDAYLTFGNVVEPQTLVRDVLSVAPGEILTLRAGDVSRKTYWRLEDVAMREPSCEEAIAETRTALRQAVTRCMVADVPVGVLLSGGIDSSSNVVLLAEQGFTNLRTFSVVFGDEDARHSEAPYSTLVAERFGTEHHPIHVGLDEALALVPNAVAAMDQPTHDGVNTYLVSHAVRRAGIKVALTGQGADELFLGYWQRRRFPALLRAAGALPSVIKAFLRAPARRLPLGGRGPSAKLVQTLLSEDPLAGAYLAEHTIFSHYEMQLLRGRARPSSTRFVRPAGGDTPLDRLSRLQLVNYLRNTLLRDGDQMSMANALELHVPFVDVDLVELVGSIPSRCKVERRRNKPLLLDAVGPNLPREVWDRPKQGFGLPYERWLREGLRVADVDATSIGLDPSAVRDARKRFDAGQAWTRWWTIEVLAAWARQHRMGARLL